MNHDENIKNGSPCSLAVQIPGTIWIVVLTMKTGSLMTSSFLYVHEIFGDFKCHDFMILIPILSLYNLTDPLNYSSKEKKRPIE